MALLDKDLSAKLIQSVADLREQEVLEIVNQRVARGDDPMDIVEDCRQGMILVGKRYEERQYYLSGLILAGEILREVTEIIQPLTELKYSGQSLGTVIVGTVQGDIHDAGKDLLQIMLNVHGFTVIDLGVDVPPQEFVDKALEVRPVAIGLSCLITGAYPSMKETIELLRSVEATRSIPIAIGGQVSEDVCSFVGADHWSVDAMDGVRWCERLTSKTGSDKQ